VPCVLGACSCFVCGGWPWAPSPSVLGTLECCGLGLALRGPLRYFAAGRLRLAVARLGLSSYCVSSSVVLVMGFGMRLLERGIVAAGFMAFGGWMFGGFGVTRSIDRTRARPAQYLHFRLRLAGKRLRTLQGGKSQRSCVPSRAEQCAFNLPHGCSARPSFCRLAASRTHLWYSHMWS